MYRFFIRKRYHAQNVSFKFINRTPETETIVFLRLCFKRVLNDPNTPILPEIRAFTQNLIFEIIRKSVFIHENMIQRNYCGWTLSKKYAPTASFTFRRNSSHESA